MKVYDWDEAVEHLKSNDARMAAIIERIGPSRMEIRHTHSIFYSLLRSIVYQQLAGKAAAAIFNRLNVAMTSSESADTHATPEQILAASEETLRAAGLSRNKMLAVKDLAAKTIDGTVPTLRMIHGMSDDEIIDRIVQVRGIGRWTVEMLLIFRLARPDVLPLDDLGVRKGIKVTYRMRALPTKEQMVKKSAKWRPWRSVGSWYMWRASELK
ncbi:MAG TPA: DNA-3-methyladenine glycosylase 2 family protein [Clostridia bacterium]|nr:DNA-3-methyladenine glycosylase 2 family protein [Clostridia bacterium]